MSVDFDLTLDQVDSEDTSLNDNKDTKLPIATDSYHPFFNIRPRPNEGNTSRNNLNDSKFSLFSDSSTNPPHLVYDSSTAPSHQEDDPSQAHRLNLTRPRKRLRQLRLTTFLDLASVQDEDPPPDVPNLKNLASKGLNRSPFHRYKAIPTPRIITLNVNTLGINEHSDRARFNKVYRCLKHLAKGGDVLLLQETNSALESLALVEVTS